MRAIVDDDTRGFADRAERCALLSLVMFKLCLKVISVLSVCGLDDLHLLAGPVLLPRLDLLIVDRCDASLEGETPLAAATVEQASDCGDGGQRNYSREDNDENLEL